MATMDYRALLYGMPRESMRRYVDDISESISGINSWLREKVDGIRQRYFSSEAISRARRTLYESSNQFRDDLIHRVSYERYTPNLLTSRYIMAEPYLYQLHRQGMSDDFGGTFLDNDPCQDPTMRKDYLNVMDGVYIPEEEGGCVITSIMEEVNPLDEYEQDLILDNWEISRGLRVMGMDPTCRK